MKQLYLTLCVFTVISLLFSDYLTEIQEIRKDFFALSKKIENENIVISLSVWETFSDKKEVFYNNNYYDVSSFRIINNFVHVKVYHDKFEMFFKAIQKHISNKSKVKNKKTIDLYFHKPFANFKFTKEHINLQKYFHDFNVNTNYLHFIFRPPIK